MKKITIAIDGFSSCGKSTMAKDLAREIGYIYIDSGAMYRAVTLYIVWRTVSFTCRRAAIQEEALRQQMGQHPAFPSSSTRKPGRPDHLPERHQRGKNDPHHGSLLPRQSRLPPSTLCAKHWWPSNRKWARPKALSWTVATSALPYFPMPN